MADVPLTLETRGVWPPWRGPDRVRNTASFLLSFLLLGVWLGWIARGGTDVVGLLWLMAVSNTVLFVSDVAWTIGPFVRVSRLVSGSFMLLSWWLVGVAR
jgi:hypothetical protein